MKLIQTTSLTAKTKAQLLELWNAEYPSTLAYPNIIAFEDYLTGLQHAQHNLLYDETAHMLAWCFEFFRDNACWFGIIVRGNCQGKGYGTKLLNHVKSTNSELNGWVIDHNNGLKLDGSTYKSPLEFYIKNSFVVVDNERLDTEKISAIKIKWTSTS